MVDNEDTSNNPISSSMEALLKQVTVHMHGEDIYFLHKKLSNLSVKYPSEQIFDEIGEKTRKCKW